MHVLTLLITHASLTAMLLLGLPALWWALSFLMGTAIAQPSINTLLKLGNGASPQVYQVVANVGDITGPGYAGAVVDVTSHSTSVPWRQKIVTLLDAGQISCKLYFIPGDLGHQTLFNQFTQRTLQGYQLSYPDTNHSTVTFNAYISKFSITATVAGVIEAAVTFDVVSEPSFWGGIQQ